MGAAAGCGACYLGKERPFQRQQDTGAAEYYDPGDQEQHMRWMLDWTGSQAIHDSVVQQMRIPKRSAEDGGALQSDRCRPCS